MDENFFGTPAARILEEILDDAFLEVYFPLNVVIISYLDDR